MTNEESVITLELRNMLGRETPPLEIEVEQGNFRRWAEAVGDYNPLWTDPQYAKKSRYGYTIAPPTFAIDRGIIPLADQLIPLSPKFLNGGTEIEFLKPIKVGDTITTTAKLIDIKEKAGSTGKLVFMTLEINYKNQNGELVRKAKNTFIQVFG